MAYEPSVPLLISIFLIIFIIAILATIFWIFMLIDAAKRKFKNENEKVAWVVILALTSWLGAIIYYFSVKHPNKK